MLDAFPEADHRPELSPVRIAGIGSPFGADRIGWEVARTLSRDPAFLDGGLSERVSISRHDRPGARLLELLEPPGLVILIDAMRGGGVPGTVRCFDGWALPADAAFQTTHDFGIKGALELAGALGGELPEVRVFGIETEGLDETRPDLSALMKKSNIISDIKELIEKYVK